MASTGGGEHSPKHRIIGAIIVVSLGFILLSNVLKDEESADRDMRSGVAAQREPAAGATASVATVDTAALPGRETHTAPAVTAGVPKVEESIAEPKVARSTTGVAQVRESSRTETPTPASPPQPATGDDSAWVVQVGAFSNSSNAERLRRQLQRDGYAVSVENFELRGSKAVRVRVGPFREKQLALQAQSRIESQTGLRGVVIASP